MKEITDKLDLIKIKNFQSMKDSVKRMRKEATGQLKIFAKHVTEIYGEPLKLNNRKTNNLIKK